MKTPGHIKFPIPRIASQSTLDRMAEKRTDAQWVSSKLAAPETRFMLFCELSLTIDSNEDRSEAEIRWHSASEIQGLSASLDDAILLGCDQTGEAAFVLGLDAAQTATLANGSDELKPVVDLRSLAMQSVLPPQDLSLAGMGRALVAWHENARHCGRCGGRTRSKDAGWRRACEDCGLETYPRTDPAVIVLITDGERCLLGHHKRYAHSFYSTLAGFVEPGEDFENCVRREMREETGIEIGKVQYMASQPWPFPHLAMIGCWAEAVTTELTIDPDELHDARWFSQEEIRQCLEDRHPDGIEVPGDHSIAHALIKSFADLES